MELNIPLEYFFTPISTSAFPGLFVDLNKRLSLAYDENIAKTRGEKKAAIKIQRWWRRILLRLIFKY